MALNQAVADVLDETIQALTFLDFNKLQVLEKRISALAKSDARCSKDSIHLIQTKKRLLKLILQSCEANLNALNRLHEKNMRDQWAH
jgi:primosomal protein N''